MTDEPCAINMKRGWRCARSKHATGPCALVPKWWNVRGRYFAWRVTR